MYATKLGNSLFICLLAILSTLAAHGETITFGDGDDQFEIEFVPVGLPGNAPDPRVDYQGEHVGRVDYEFGMAMFETTCTDIDIAKRQGGFTRLSGTFNSCGDNGPKQPGSLFITDAREFVNWLNTSNGYAPAYNTVNANQPIQDWEPTDPGYDPSNPIRNANARFFLPNGDEFHKAAYFDPATKTYLDYATGSNTPPTPVLGGSAPNTMVVHRMGTATAVDNAGGLSAFGTMAQVGNLIEWEEDFQYHNVGVDAILGFSYAVSRQREVLTGGRGFRVVSIPIPEPKSMSLALTGCIAVLARMRRRKRNL